MDATIGDNWVNKYVYELYGIVTHSGSMRGGHYVAYVSYK
jgi:ubiquitin C-terminal hydrolase